MALQNDGISNGALAQGNGVPSDLLAQDLQAPVSTPESALVSLAKMREEYEKAQENQIQNFLDQHGLVVQEKLYHNAMTGTHVYHCI
jgi:hypothetical protein